jgi:hypothetical protein
MGHRWSQWVGIMGEGIIKTAVISADSPSINATNAIDGHLFNGDFFHFKNVVFSFGLLNIQDGVFFLFFFVKHGLLLAHPDNPNNNNVVLMSLGSGSGSGVSASLPIRSKKFLGGFGSGVKGMRNKWRSFMLLFPTMPARQ